MGPRPSSQSCPSAQAVGSASCVGCARVTSTWHAYALSSSVLVRGSTSVSSNWSMIAALLTRFPAFVGVAGPSSGAAAAVSISGIQVRQAHCFAARSPKEYQHEHLCSCEWSSVWCSSYRDSRGAHGMLQHTCRQTRHVPHLLNLPEGVIYTLPNLLA